MFCYFFLKTNYIVKLQEGRQNIAIDLSSNNNVIVPSSVPVDNNQPDNSNFCHTGEISTNTLSNPKKGKKKGNWV